MRVSSSGVLRPRVVAIGVHATGILGVLVDDGPPALLFGEQFLDLPVILLGPDGELEVLAGDGVPILVSRQVADGSEEQPIQVMAHSRADVVAEHIQDHLSNDQEEDPKRNIPQGPAILQRVGHEDDLHHDIDHERNAIDQIQHDKQAHGIRRAEPSPLLERRERDHECDDEHGEADTIDQETHAQGGGEPALDRDEVGEDAVPRGDDARVQAERDEGEEHYRTATLPPDQHTNRRELAAHMEDHDHSHDQRGNVRERRRSLEDDGVRDLNVPRIAVGLDALAQEAGDLAHERTQRYWCLGTDRLEVAEAHDRDVSGLGSGMDGSRRPAVRCGALRIRCRPPILAQEQY
ncbi:hypothetical protein BP6252_00625 [Coleophoma cylindrospora]|uniref:Uncharacterized protein n=1 Tax=Coleophoma cylindrospora TaxID=1849047 RepID=A0A3D8SQK3_9HELO|nr:hypothetical protein BP6252_00625 [Coleophoma cylindrospora]